MARENVFISYSHADDRWRERLVSHLKVLVAEGYIHLWDDSSITVGEDWQARISAELDRAGGRCVARLGTVSHVRVCSAKGDAIDPSNVMAMAA